MARLPHCFKAIRLAALLLALALISTTTEGFVSTSSTGLCSSNRVIAKSHTSPRSTLTSLSERKWNFNEGQAPWGLKKNAETWNGRVAQVAFVWVFLQELITGKGIFKGLEEGDAFFIANAAAFGLTVVGLTAWLAIQGTDDYTKE
mmetsp:Transcript_17143/g.27799  ORF Transcript_17143/g.27799 Transcript_17143/m.27799 type:complete len:146 (+) Transcript_17143:90-527(+)